VADGAIWSRRERVHWEERAIQLVKTPSKNVTRKKNTLQGLSPSIRSEGGGEKRLATPNRRKRMWGTVVRKKAKGCWGGKPDQRGRGLRQKKKAQVHGARKAKRKRWEKLPKAESGEHIH